MKLTGKTKLVIINLYCWLMSLLTYGNYVLGGRVDKLKGLESSIWMVAAIIIIAVSINKEDEE